MPFFLARGTRLKVKIQEKQKAEKISALILTTLSTWQSSTGFCSSRGSHSGLFFSRYYLPLLFRPTFNNTLTISLDESRTMRFRNRKRIHFLSLSDPEYGSRKICPPQYLFHYPKPPPLVVSDLRVQNTIFSPVIFSQHSYQEKATEDAEKPMSDNNYSFWHLPRLLSHLLAC